MVYINYPGIFVEFRFEHDHDADFGVNTIAFLVSGQLPFIVQ